MSLPLSSLLSTLEALAPLALAEEWDNVGLLIDPRAAGSELQIERVLLTIDASLPVVQEALEGRFQCLLAYHPPIFRPRKRLAAREDAALFAALSGGFAVYSPHTALDSAPLGLNDWLIEAFGEGTVRAVTPHATLDHNAELKLVVFVPKSHADPLRDALAAVGAGTIGAYTRCSFNLDGEGTFFGNDGAAPVVGGPGRLERAQETRLEMVCPRRALPHLAGVIARVHPYEEPAWDVYPLAPKPLAKAGRGREIELAAPLRLSEAIARVKAHLVLSHVRVAASAEHARGAPLRRVAVAAGAGGSVFEDCAGADLLVTGEMRHHDVLARLAAGQSVLLCEHTHTERGYLPRLRQRLLDATSERIEVRIAQNDHEPLVVA